MPQVHGELVDGICLSVTTWECELPAHPPVVLLAGTGATSSDWDPIAEDLSRDRVVHAVDLRGHGPSTWPGRYSIGLMAHDIAALLPRLGGDLDVISHSLGGLVACRVAADNRRIRRLVLEDVGVPHPRTPTPVTRPPGPLSFDWAVVEQVRPEIDDPDPDWVHLLATIQAPTLAISGGTASFVPTEHVRELADTVAVGTLVTIEAGHLVHASRPAEFLRAARGHLDQPRT